MTSQNLHHLPIEEATLLYEEAVNNELAALSDLVFKLKQWQVSKVGSVQDLQQILGDVHRHLELLQSAIQSRLYLAHVIAPIFEQWVKDNVHEIKEK